MTVCRPALGWKRLCFLSVVGLVLLSLLGGAAAGEPDYYYVDGQHGDDRNPGTDPAAPARTITRVLEGLPPVSSPGSIINIAAGTYRENLVITQSRVTLFGVGADSVIIHPEPNRPVAGRVGRLGNEQVVRIIGIRAKNCSVLELQNLTVTGGDAGIVFESVTQSRIQSCRVHDNSRFGIYLTNRCLNNLIEANQVFANGGSGILLEDGSSDNRLLRNRSYDEGAPGIKLDHQANHNQLEENECWNNGSDGIMVVGSHHNLLRGNTSRDNVRAPNLSGFWIYQSRGTVLTGNRSDNNGLAGYHFQASPETEFRDDNQASGNPDGEVRYTDQPAPEGEPFTSPLTIEQRENTIVTIAVIVLIGILFLLVVIAITLVLIARWIRRAALRPPP